MTAVQPEEFFVEVLQDVAAERADAGVSGYDVIVEFGNVFVSGSPIVQPEIVEVFSMPPVGGGIDRVEVLPFTRQGNLSVTSTGFEFPIAGGNFLLESIAARVSGSAPVGSSIVLDILKNNVSIFSTPGNRPTIAAGTRDAVTTIPTGVMFASGDYIEVIIVAVGSTTPGSDLVASVRLARIG